METEVISHSEGAERVVSSNMLLVKKSPGRSGYELLSKGQLDEYLEGGQNNVFDTYEFTEVREEPDGTLTGIWVNKAGSNGERISIDQISESLDPDKAE